MAESNPSYEELVAEVARLKAQLARSESGVKGARQRVQSRWKSLGMGVLIGIGCIALVVANLALWAQRNLVSQDGYVKAATQVIKQPQVQAALVKAGHDQFMSSVDVPAVVQQVLPEKAAFLAGPITTQVENGVQQVLQHIVSGQRFQTVWVNVNSRAHERVVHTLATYQGNGQIDLEDVYKYLGAQLANTPLAAVANTSLPAKFGSITVIDASWLPAAQQAYHALNLAVPLGFIVALICLAGALWWSSRRRRTLITMSIAIAISLVVAGVAVRVVRELRLDQYHDSTYRAAAEAVWGVVLTPLFTQTRVWLAIAVLVLVGAWVTGPYRAAAGLRAVLSRGAESLYTFTGNFGANSPAVQWLRKRRRTVEWTLLGLDLLVLAFLTPLTLSVVLWAVVGLLVLLALVEILTSGRTNATN
jgi:hypothetical protein